MFTRAKTAIAGVTAAAMLAASSLSVVPAAQAASLSPAVPAVHYGQGEAPVILAGHKAKWRWRRHHRRHHRHRGWDNDIPLGIFGFAAGAMVGSMLAQPRRSYRYSDWHSYCASKYRTYKPWTGTYTGYDGRQHRCR